MEALRTRFAMRVAARLSQRAESVPADVSERLRFAREQAVERARVVRTAAQREAAAVGVVPNRGATLALGRGGSDGPWWVKLAAALPLVFQRILSNATMDWFRRQKVRNALVKNFSDFESAGDDSDFDILETLEALNGSTGSESAADAVSRSQILVVIESHIEQLPARQREAFLLRYWEELDVSETAAAMGCSEGSVKTHCSRAVHALAKALKAKGIAP
jgi:RNA polymerase sigma-70 factor (ECF subfamily)